MTLDANLSACALSGQMSAEQLHQHHMAGELPVQMLCAEPDFTTVPSAEYRRLQYLSDYATVVIIESLARRVKTSHPRQVFDVNTPDEQEMPSGSTIAEMAEALGHATKHGDEHGYLDRPIPGCPHFVSFKGA